jgi:1,2-diacylglycerol 3-alpha-glucosyltransferase
VVIAVFTESFRPVVNGVSVSVETFARELTALGHEVHVFAPRYPGYTDNWPFQVHRLPSITTPFARDYPLPIPISGRLHRLLLDAGINLIHTQSPFLSGWSGAFWAKKLHIPLVTTHHTIYTEYVHYAKIVPPALAKRVVIAITRRHCNRANLVIVPTEPIIGLLRSYGVTAPIKAVPTGVDVESIASAPPEWAINQYGIPEGNKVVLYAGRLAPEKNVLELIRAFALISRARSDVVFLVVGGGPSADDCKRLAASLGIGERVRFTGVLHPPHLYSCYAAADLMLYPSLTDTQGMVLCEALAAGTPCVAANAYGATSVVQHGIDGILVPGSAESLAQAALELLSDPEKLEAMSRNARENAKRFGRRECALKMLSAYNEAIQNAEKELLFKSKR